MKLLLAALLVSLALSASCLAEQNENLVEEYRNIRDQLDSNLVNELEVLLFYLSTWRLVRLHLNELKEATAELVNNKPITKEDALILFDEVKVRARELKIKLDQTDKTSIGGAVHELVVKPCQVYRDALEEPVFRQVEAEDPRLESYYDDSSKMDFYTGWATLRMCENLMKEVEHGSLIENMRIEPAVDYNSL